MSDIATAVYHIRTAPARTWTAAFGTRSAWWDAADSAKTRSVIITCAYIVGDERFEMERRRTIANVLGTEELGVKRRVLAN